MVGQEQERLCPVATLDRADHARRLDCVDGIYRSFEPDSLGEAGHDELKIVDETCWRLFALCRARDNTPVLSIR